MKYAPTERGVVIGLIVAMAAIGIGPKVAAAAGTFVENDVTVLRTLSGTGSFGWAGVVLQDISNPPDGANDLIITAPNANHVWVYSGRDATLIYELQPPTGDGGSFGNGAADAGDVDHDGVHDIIVGAPGSSLGPNPGHAHVFSGADGSLIWRFEGEAAQSQFGYAVADAGDVDQDGHEDVIVGAPFLDGIATSSGRAYIYSGADGTLIRQLDPSGGNELMGTAVSGAVDYDKDGIPDQIVTAPGTGIGFGKAYVFSGADGSVILTATADSDATNFGVFFVNDVGDVNNDTYHDFYVGDYGASGGRGKGYVFSGNPADGGAAIHVFPGDPGEGVGPARGPLGDVNGDGTPDLVIGHWTSSIGASGAGRVVIRNGRTGAVLRTITSTTAGEQLGFDAAGIGDVNDDGLTDYLLTAAGQNRAYVIAGTDLTGCSPSDAPTLVVGAVDANRYLALSPPQDGQQSAIRVTLSDLDGFAGSNGEVRWVGPPAVYNDIAPGATFSAASLQCDPYFTDWSTWDELYVYGAAVVPGSSYSVQAVTQDCGADAQESDFSTSIELHTQQWGDVIAPFASPMATQPDFADISALVEAFLGNASAPKLPRDQLHPTILAPSSPTDFTDISDCVDAFLGQSYPYAGPEACTP